MKELLQIRMVVTPWNRATPPPLCQGLLISRLFVSGLLLLGILLLGNCARAPTPGSKLPPHPDFVTATPPDKAPAIPGELTNDPQASNRFSSDIRMLQSVLDAHPDTVVALETKMALARTHERAGDRAAALQIYREVVRQASSGSSKKFRQQAVERLSVLGKPTSGVQTLARPAVAVLVSASQMPPRHQWVQWLTDLQQAEVTVLVIEVGTKPRGGAVRSTASRSARAHASDGSPGVFFQTKWAPVKKPLVNQIIPLARQKGLVVYAAVTLRRMPWLESRVRWADWAYQLDANRLTRSKALDIFHPAVQKYHVGFLTDLVKSGIDGLLFRADAPMGPFEGLTRFGLAGFRKQHAIELNARILFPPRPPGNESKRSERHQRRKLSNGTGSTTIPTTNAKKPSVTSRFSPAYWKWEGWKVREQLQVMGRYITRLRKQAPGLNIAMEVHREALSQPIAAMLRYSEDVAEARHLGVQYLVTPLGTPGSGPVRLADKTVPESAQTNQSTTSFMTQALAVVEKPEHIWVRHHVPDGQVSTIGQVIPVRRDQLSLPKGVGLFYTLDKPVLP